MHFKKLFFFRQMKMETIATSSIALMRTRAIVVTKCATISPATGSGAETMRVDFHVTVCSATGA